MNTYTMLHFLNRCILFISISYLTLSYNFILIHASNGNSISSHIKKNPYKALGISKDATQDEIKKAYRTLCLKYHPDKHVNKSHFEQQRNEQLFKDVQEANSLIGTMDARQKYDNDVLFRQYHSSSSFSSNPSSYYYNHDVFQRTTPSSQNNRRRRNTSFYVNGIDLSHLFSTSTTTSTMNHPSQDTTMPQYNPKSIFVQKIQIPLEELYSGVSRKPLYLQNTLWTRYRAAFRGGMALHIAIQSFFTSLPLLFRTGPILFVTSFVLLFHLNIPQPTKTTFYASIPKGWKQGTKLKFQNGKDGGVTPMMEYIFIVEEGKHTRYTRVGDDLHTNVSITKDMAKNGCTVCMDPLDEKDGVIQIDLKPGEISQKKQNVIIKGKGWPKSDGTYVGDLIVSVRIVSSGRSASSRRGCLGSLRHTKDKSTMKKQKGRI